MGAETYLMFKKCVFVIFVFTNSLNNSTSEIVSHFLSGLKLGAIICGFVWLNSNY